MQSELLKTYDGDDYNDYDSDDYYDNNDNDDDDNYDDVKNIIIVEIVLKMNIISERNTYLDWQRQGLLPWYRMR
jgi:hypothetical protein